MKLSTGTMPFEAVRTLLIHSRNKGVSEAGSLGLLWAAYVASHPIIDTNFLSVLGALPIVRTP